MIYPFVIALTIFAYVHSFNWISKMYLNGEISSLQDLIKMFLVVVETTTLGS